MKRSPLQILQKMANLSLCSLGSFPHKCLVRFYWGPFHHFDSIFQIWLLILILLILLIFWILLISWCGSSFSNKKKESKLCRNSFSAVSKALMLSDGAFFTEWYTLQRKTKRKHGIHEKTTVSANPKLRARASAHPRMSQNPLQMRIIRQKRGRKPYVFMFPIHKYGSAHRQNRDRVQLLALFPELLWKVKNSSISQSYDQNKPSPSWFCIKKFAFLSRLVLLWIGEFFDSFFTFC